MSLAIVAFCLLGLVLLAMLLILWDAHSTHKKNAIATFKVLDQRAKDLHERLETVERSTTNTAAWEHSYFRPVGKKTDAA